MREIWQQDVLRYLTDRGCASSTDDPSVALGLHIPQELVRTELNLRGDDSRLDNFVNRRSNVAYSQDLSAADVVDKLVSPLVQSGKIDPDRELQNFHDFLHNEEIRDTWADYTGYEQVLTAAFTEALRRHHPYAAPPRIQNTRLAPGSSFIGREAELETLESLLSENGAVVLSGIGGIGKTSLAEEYARRNAEQYSACQVVRVEPWSDSAVDLIHAVRFTDSADEEAVNVSIEAAAEYLRSLDSSTLLIFDGVDNLYVDKETFDRLIDESGARVIVTTRQSGLFSEIPEMEITALAEDEQMRLLEVEMGRTVPERDIASALEVCRSTAGNTLIIYLLGRIARERNLSVPQLLRHLSALKGLSGSESSVQAPRDSASIRDLVAEVLSSLSTVSLAERSLLKNLTLLPLGGIPLSVLTSDPFVWKPNDFIMLENSGWIIYNPEDGMVRLHPVVREAILSITEVDSVACQPFLDMVVDALYEPSWSFRMLHLLRLAASIVEMIYISEPLHDLLESERIKPLVEEGVDAGLKSGPTNYMPDTLYTASLDPGITPEESTSLRMYALLMEYTQRTRADSPREYTDTPFYTVDSFMAYHASNEEEYLQRIKEEIQSLFLQLKVADLTEHQRALLESAPDVLPTLALIEATRVALQYIKNSRLLYGHPDESAGAFNQLSSEEMELLKTVTRPAFRSFLTAALGELSENMELAPLACSEALVALVHLFDLLDRGSREITSAAEALEYRGWAFPELTYLPRRYKLSDFKFREELWGLPYTETVYTRGEKAFIVHMRRTRDDGEKLDNDDMDGYGEPQHLEDRTIWTAVDRNYAGGDVLVEIGPWRILMDSPDDDVSKNALISVARGIRLP